MAMNAASVGKFYKDVDSEILRAILDYYSKDMIYLGYGLDQSLWALTF